MRCPPCRSSGRGGAAFSRTTGEPWADGGALIGCRRGRSWRPGRGPGGRAPPAAAYPSNSVTLTGHGFGHGRGMGQWGAFGYAIAGALVEHRHALLLRSRLPGPTSPGQEGPQVRVVLTENDGNDVIVTSGTRIHGRRGTTSAPGQAVFMHADGAGRGLRCGPSCAGPPGHRSRSPAGWRTPWRSPTPTPTLGDPNAAALALQLCQFPAATSPSGDPSRRPTTAGPGARPATVNIVPSRTTWPAWCPTSLRPTGGRSVRPGRRARRGASRSSRPRRWPHAPM